MLKKTILGILSLLFTISYAQDNNDKALYKNKMPMPTVSEVIDNGQYLILSDNSLWEISPIDKNIVLGWIGPAEIMIIDSNNPDYPKRLVNKTTLDSIEARQVSKDVLEQTYQEDDVQKSDEQQLLEKQTQKEKQLEDTQTPQVKK